MTTAKLVGNDIHKSYVDSSSSELRSFIKEKYMKDKKQKDQERKSVLLNLQVLLPTSLIITTKTDYSRIKNAKDINELFSLGSNIEVSAYTSELSDVSSNMKATEDINELSDTGL